MKRCFVPAWALALALTLALAGGAAAADRPGLLVFAAASTTNAMNDLARAFQERTGAVVTNSFASSSTLARQIARGAPADLYLSANRKWMDYLEKEGGVAAGSRHDLLANRLVLIAPADGPQGPVDLATVKDLAPLLGDGRLAMGDPDHVPAGIYGRQALTGLGLWPGAAGRLAPAASVRVALAWVAAGEARLGVVYATDARVEPRVRVVAEFPESSHPPIVYPVALVAGRDSPLARRYLEFLASPEAGAVFAAYGFRTR